MIFKRFSLQRKNPKLCNICEQEMLQSNFLSKNKNFVRPWLFYSYYITIHKVWVDLINEQQQNTQDLLGKISESHGINLSRGQ